MTGVQTCALPISGFFLPSLFHGGEGWGNDAHSPSNLTHAVLDLYHTHTRALYRSHHALPQPRLVPSSAFCSPAVGGSFSLWFRCFFPTHHFPPPCVRCHAHQKLLPLPYLSTGTTLPPPLVGFGGSCSARSSYLPPSRASLLRWCWCWPWRWGPASLSPRHRTSPRRTAPHARARARRSSLLLSSRWARNSDDFLVASAWGAASGGSFAEFRRGKGGG